MASGQKLVVLPLARQIPASMGYWSASSRRATGQVVAQYGLPDEATDYHLTWHYNSPWKRTTVYRSGPYHHFPRPHFDVLAQTVDYRVPPEAIVPLARFTGSLAVDIAREELTAHCDSEEMNRMILNLAHDIVAGQHTPEQAQVLLRSMIAGLRLHWPEEYAHTLHFDWNIWVADRQMRW